jgi:hypothetical protein
VRHLFLKPDIEEKPLTVFLLVRGFSVLFGRVAVGWLWCGCDGITECGGRSSARCTAWTVAVKGSCRLTSATTIGPGGGMVIRVAVGYSCFRYHRYGEAGNGAFERSGCGDPCRADLG